MKKNIEGQYWLVGSILDYEVENDGSVKLKVGFVGYFFQLGSCAKTYPSSYYRLISTIGGAQNDVPRLRERRSSTKIDDEDTREEMLPKNISIYKWWRCLLEMP